ncbi:hypothetical protein [Chamaesiphon minutus]|uniref:Uncharacterized protein n=1 Tax=Chamaesiphon minutus (strain ATCC 27169 / PCC 6605) TaxID=1173020 RepID=K9URF4_CHAP6|nr:hypothetical protein [Chamaesiphon minutus]AFY97253.1 hypothetical protein Cha6605_6438 [Chamaesiphon minutus PCC 6605]
MSFSKQIIDLEALLYALAQQTEPLPESLQQSLIEVGRSLHEDRPDTARELRALIQQYSPLELEYQRALTKWDENYTSQERAKTLDATFSIASGLDDLFIERVLPATNWVTATKKLANSSKYLKQRSQFLERGDRVVALASGGAFLGVLIAQIPGAVIGGVLAGVYAWLSFPTVVTGRK